jgi:hypothetical protein
LGNIRKMEISDLELVGLVFDSHCRPKQLI